MVTYRGYIQVSTDDSANTVLGLVTPDPNYWTPFLSNDETAALQIEFSMPVGATSGTQLQLQQIVSCRFSTNCYETFEPTLF